jgi:predicted DCC family thiol-disulfide oxidoreductase YuxK
LEVVVIYDGQCHFCEQSVTWIQQKLKITALSFQSADLSAFNLTREQCAKQVYVISEGKTYGGADAIAFLLKQRGNKVAASTLKLSGGLGRAGYKWLASHRNSLAVKVASRLLQYLNGK